ncbi:MAG: hypothetical protein JNN30_17760 [Rhodanobacteraceae bacterium]|nr:hypothetical protein [Rhodanobacteraceae bacterium]
MSIRFRAASSNLSPAAIAAIRKVCDLSIGDLRTRAARAEWLFEIEVFAGEWPRSKPRLVLLLKDIQNGILPLTVSEYSDTDGEDDPLSIEEAFARVQFFRHIALEQDMLSQLQAGYISTREEYEPPGEDEA